jgi:hypothetical protein
VLAENSSQTGYDLADKLPMQHWGEHDGERTIADNLLEGAFGVLAVISLAGSVVGAYLMFWR